MHPRVVHTLLSQRPPLRATTPSGTGPELPSEGPMRVTCPRSSSTVRSDIMTDRRAAAPPGTAHARPGHAPIIDR